MLPKWMNRGVVLLSLSAFFADAGYQAVQALFPIYLVLSLSSSAAYFGLANALAYGGGAVFAYLAGILGTRYSRKRLALIGSAFILLMPLTGATMNPLLAIALFAMGWWARNFRVPPRRALLSDMSTDANRGKVFGFLHLLDIGGGMTAVVLVLLELAIGIGERSALMLTAIPLTISVLFVGLSPDARKHEPHTAEAARAHASKPKANRVAFKGIIAATALYGFSYYSLGFPILTIAKSSNTMFGIGAYGVYLGVSALAGYYIGSRKWHDRIRVLGYMGYILSGIGTAILAIGYIFGGPLLLYYLGVAIMGLALGAIETMEPTIVSMLRGVARLDTRMGSLQAYRSIGLFFANLIMGVLYVVSPAYSYMYAAAISVLSGAIVIFTGQQRSSITRSADAHHSGTS